MKNLIKRFCAIILVAAVISAPMMLANKSGSGSTVNNYYTEEDTESGERLQADWIDTAIIYEVNVRQYTDEGTFNAFGEHLKRLKDMGVNTLWFMPIYPISQTGKKGTLGSYYSIADYTSVNPEFGTLEDFKALVNEAHEMGFHIMLDWVGNHTGWDHTWITEHPDYYVHDDDGNIIWPANTDWTDVAQLDYSNTDMRQAMIDAMSFWIKDIGIDGFRCDYAQGVPVDFWQEARTALDEIKPIYMLAEDGTMSDGLIAKAFDSDYNFNLYSGLKFSAKNADTADDLITSLDEDLPYGAFRMSFLDNHDENTYSDTMENRYGKDAIPALYSVIFTSKGIPLIYSGNEEGSDISLEFFEKDNINFSDYEYKELLTKLCNIRTENEALYNGVYGGTFRALTTDNKSVLAYERIKDNKKITTIVNLSSDEEEVSYEEGISSGDILIHGDGSGISDDEGSAVTTSDVSKLGAYEYYIIYSEK